MVAMSLPAMIVISAFIGYPARDAASAETSHSRLRRALSARASRSALVLLRWAADRVRLSVCAMLKNAYQGYAREVPVFGSDKALILKLKLSDVACIALT
jgi:hypothetical protein